MMPLGVLAGSRHVAAGSSSWAPSDISSLAAWWDASAIAGLSDGATVSSWPDLSGNTHDLATDPLGEAPTYRTGVRSGNAVVRFDGIADCLIAPNVLAPGAAVYEMVAVLTLANRAALQVPLSNQRANPPRTGGALILSASGARGIYAIGSYVTYNGGAYTPGTWERWNLASTAELFVNGSSVDTDSALVEGGTIRLGAAVKTASNALEFVSQMDVAEVLVCSDVLSAGERSALDSYLATKWGF